VKKANNNNPNLNLNQLAAELNCAYLTAWMLVSEKGAFPGAFRLTNRPHSPWRVPRADVLAYITRRGCEVVGG
jgi:predicted DNA-binding transcriptional regulator AlpA